MPSNLDASMFNISPHDDTHPLYHSENLSTATDHKLLKLYLCHISFQVAKWLTDLIRCSNSNSSFLMVEAPVVFGK